jgi:hypothetical protein
MKTRNFLLYGFLLLSALPAISQVGIGTSSPVSSAALDVSSTNKGLMPPRQNSFVLGVTSVLLLLRLLLLLFSYQKD